jgi:hypothetical protein
MQLNPEIYERERSRVAARFEEAVELAEQAFLSEFAKLVSHLTERLGSEENGDRKIFRDTVVTNLVEFFDRFRQLNVRSNTELDDLVARAQRVVRGVEAQQLRDDASLRQQIATQLSTVQASLDQMMVNQPRRRLVYEPSPQGDVA